MWDPFKYLKMEVSIVDAHCIATFSWLFYNQIVTFNRFIFSRLLEDWKMVHIVRSIDNSNNSATTIKGQKHMIGYEV